MPSPGAAILSGTHVDAAGDDAFVDGRGVNSSTQSGRSAESAHQEAEVGAEVSFSLSAVVVPRFHWAEGDDGHPPSHPAIVLKRPRAKIRWHLTREGLGNTVESYVGLGNTVESYVVPVLGNTVESYVVATLVEARDWRVWRDDEVKSHGEKRTNEEGRTPELMTHSTQRLSCFVLCSFLFLPSHRIHSPQPQSTEIGRCSTPVPVGCKVLSTSTTVALVSVAAQRDGSLASQIQPKL